MGNRSHKENCLGIPQAISKSRPRGFRRSPAGMPVALGPGTRAARPSRRRAPQSPICHRFFTDYVREKAADKRGGEQEPLSLDAPVDGSDDGLTLGDLIADTTIADSGDAVGSTRHHTELDVARALEQLTPMQRKQ